MCNILEATIHKSSFKYNLIQLSKHLSSTYYMPDSVSCVRINRLIRQGVFGLNPFEKGRRWWGLSSILGVGKEGTQRKTRDILLFY